MKTDPTTTPSSLLPSLLLLGLSSLLLLSHGSDQSLIGADEGYYAQMAREMVQSGQWLIPTFLGNPFFEKPPLLQWLMAVSYQLGGVHEWTARAPSWLAGMLTVQLTFALGRQWLTQRAAFYGALMLCGMYLWLTNGRVGGQDMLLTALELFGVWCLSVATRRGWRIAALGWGLSIGLGLLLKSAMIILAVLAVLPYLWFERRRHQLLQNPFLYLGAGLGLLSFGLWLWAAQQVYGNQVVQGLIGKVVTLGAKEFYPAGPFYYFWNIPANTFPWLFFALGGLWILLKTDTWQDYLLLWSYPLTFFLILQVYSTKTPYYPLQLAPFIALLGAFYLDSLLQPEALKRSVSAITVISVLLFGLAILLIMTASTLYVAPQLLPEGLIYRPLALGLGLTWCLPLAARIGQRWLRRWQDLWVIGVLAGPIVVLAVAVIVTPIGNYNPEFKVFCQTRWPRQLIQPVDLAYEANGQEVSDLIALAFYTPQPRHELRAAQIMRGEGQNVLWLSPETRIILLQRHYPFRVLAQVKGWTLAQKIRRPLPKLPTKKVT